GDGPRTNPRWNRAVAVRSERLRRGDAREADRCGGDADEFPPRQLVARHETPCAYGQSLRNGHTAQWGSLSVHVAAAWCVRYVHVRRYSSTDSGSSDSGASSYPSRRMTRPTPSSIGKTR